MNTKTINSKNMNRKNQIIQKIFLVLNIGIAWFFGFVIAFVQWSTV